MPRSYFPSCLISKFVKVFAGSSGWNIYSSGQREEYRVNVSRVKIMYFAPNFVYTIESDVVYTIETDVVTGIHVHC